MRTIRLGLIVAILAAAEATFAAEAPSVRNSTPLRHLAIAESLVAHLSLENTGYNHGEGHVSFTAPFESHTDCSGFIDALLTESYGVDKDTFREWFGSGRPTAKRYHDAIEAEKGFKRIDRVQDIRPGDLLAVKYLKRTDNTGHVMLAVSRAKQMAAKEPNVPGTLQWEITIIDSSESGHGPSDTRHHQGPGGKDHDGLGEGVLRIYSDAGGTIAGFAWSTLKASKLKDPSDEHLLVGRLK